MILWFSVWLVVTIQTFFTYNKQSYEINDFLIIPKYFFVEDIIEKRKPLGQHARRAGWVGCNILINNVPNIGKIYYVKNGLFLSKNEVMENWNRTTFIKTTSNIEEKGWIFDVLKCVEKIRRPIFDLSCKRSDFMWMGTKINKKENTKSRKNK